MRDAAPDRGRLAKAEAALKPLLAAVTARNASPDAVLARLSTEMLASRTHLQLAPAEPNVRAKDIRASAKRLRTEVDALSAPSERVELLQRVRRVFTTVVRADLTGRKRLYTTEHVSQANIRAVTPDRPATAGMGNAASGGPSAPAGAGSTTPTRPRASGGARLSAFTRVSVRETELVWRLTAVSEGGPGRDLLFTLV